MPLKCKTAFLFTDNQLIDYTCGIVLHGSPKAGVGHISTDTRTIQPSDAFLPIIGERFDGHTFIKVALEKGVRVIYVQQEYWQTIQPLSRMYSDVLFIGVRDTLLAYHGLANGFLCSKSFPKIGITGSTGKTTTKELLKSILSTKYRVHATHGNLNNLIGLPKTVLSIPDKTDLAIFEMGSGKPGDIPLMVETVQPDSAMITSIGTAHIEFFTSQEAIAQEKGSIFRYLDGDGIGLYPEGCPYVNHLQEYTSQSLIPFSLRNAHIEILEDLGVGGYRIAIQGVCGIFPLPGMFNLLNLSAAVLMGVWAEVPPEIMVQSLATIELPGMRLERRQGKVELILDCYNANPESMRAGITWYNYLPRPKRKIAIVGDMLELGTQSSSLHYETGVAIGESNLIDVFVCVGKEAEAIYRGILHSHRGEASIQYFPTVEALSNKLSSLIRPDDSIYVKASRRLALETLAEHLL
jgi:UDP-N-acetylmuramoyl-tripeptide--D-alanyl-D-alanine ligase